DACFARHHRHVRGIRDDDRAIGEAAAGTRIRELCELIENIGHLVAAFTAPDVDDDVGVAPLRNLLKQQRLTGAESARYCGATSSTDGIEHVQDSLAGHKGPVDVSTFGTGARLSNGPYLEHRDANPVDAHQLFVGPVRSCFTHEVDVAAYSCRGKNAILKRATGFDDSK